MGGSHPSFGFAHHSHVRSKARQQCRKHACDKGRDDLYRIQRDKVFGMPAAVSKFSGVRDRTQIRGTAQKGC